MIPAAMTMMSTVIAGSGGPLASIPLDFTAAFAPLGGLLAGFVLASLAALVLHAVRHAALPAKTVGAPKGITTEQEIVLQQVA